MAAMHGCEGATRRGVTAILALTVAIELAATDGLTNIDGASARVQAVVMMLLFMATFAFFVGASILAIMFAFGLNALIWVVAARVLHTLHDRGPSRKQIVSMGMLMIGLALAPSPKNWLAKWAGLPEVQENSASSK